MQYQPIISSAHTMTEDEYLDLVNDAGLEEILDIDPDEIEFDENDEF